MSGMRNPSASFYCRCVRHGNSKRSGDYGNLNLAQARENPFPQRRLIQPRRLFRGLPPFNCFPLLHLRFGSTRLGNGTMCRDSSLMRCDFEILTRCCYRTLAAVLLPILLGVTTHSTQVWIISVGCVSRK